MSVDTIQLVGTDVPNSYGSCCFTGHVQHEALNWVTEPMPPIGSASQSPTPASRCESQLLFFNCPEGTQRFSAEAAIRLVRTRGFFFTRWVPSTVMGMPGLLFTINDAGVHHANFFGPGGMGMTGGSDEVQGVGDSAAAAQSSSCGSDVIGNCTGGLAEMLDALRRHYFVYRQMSFQQLRVGQLPRRLSTSMPGNYVYEVPLLFDRSETISTVGQGRGHRVPEAAALSLSSFFVIALQLSTTSALVGFRISQGNKSDADEVYGYAILHAPAAVFDCRCAKALGVPAGPLYGQLKQGVGVWVDDPPTPGAEGECNTRRFIDPRSVQQATVGSQSLYVTLVLDGDSVCDVATAMETLFGRDGAGAEERDFRQEHSTVDGGDCSTSGKLYELLKQWKPQFAYRSHGANLCKDDGTAQVERTISLVHVVHVQCLQFFSSIGGGNHVIGQSLYISNVFAHVFPPVRQDAMKCLSNDANFPVGLEPPTAGGTKHHFCADVQSTFSAFPTALAHRYHLNSIAAQQFPLASSLSEKSDSEPSECWIRHCYVDDGKGPVWPYAVKHLLIPPGASTPLVTEISDDPSAAHVLVERLAGATLSARSGLENFDKQNVAGREKKGTNVKGLLRYPTATSAAAMLSEQFRSAVAAVRHDTSTSATRLDLSTLQGREYNVDGGGALSFLGTGSAIPSKYRNVSGAFVEVVYTSQHREPPCRAIVVLDFGEGSTGQLSMLYGHGEEQLRDFVRDLTFVFISHSHADHHLGLLSLLELRHRLFFERDANGKQRDAIEPILIVCPQEVWAFLMETWGQSRSCGQWLSEEVIFDVFPAEDGEEQLRSDVAFLPHLNELCSKLCSKMVSSQSDIVSDEAVPRRANRPLWAAEVFPVDHPANAHALLLRFPVHQATPSDLAPSRVLLFSGDTRPSPFLVERCCQFTDTTCRDSEESQDPIGGVYICLHEATFGDGCEDEAMRKSHSTLREALGVAGAIGARHVVLNHFSQRYPKLPGLTKAHLGGRDVDLHCKRRGHRPKQTERPTLVSEEMEQEPEQPMCFGFDFMRLTFAALERGEVSRLTPLFVQLLQEYESWGVGTTKRLRE